MWVPEFVIRMIGRSIAQKANLQEGGLMPTKSWYLSKTVWSDVVTILLGAVGFVDKYWMAGHIATSPFYAMALTLLGAMGLYGRVTAATTITS